MLLNIFPIAALNSSVYLLIFYWIHIFFLCGSHLSLFVSKYHFCFFLFWETLIIAGLTVQTTSSQQSEALEISPQFLQLTAQLWFSLSCSEFLCERHLSGFESVGGLLRCGSTLWGFLSSSILSVIVDLSLSSHTSKTEAVSLRSSTTLPLLCTLGDGLSRNPFKYGP